MSNIEIIKNQPFNELIPTIEKTDLTTDQCQELINYFNTKLQEYRLTYKDQNNVSSVIFKKAMSVLTKKK